MPARPVPGSGQLVSRMREALDRHARTQRHKTVCVELKKARTVLLETVFRDRMRAKLAWTARRAKKGSEGCAKEGSLPHHIEVRAYTLPAGQVVCAIIIHPQPDEASCRVLRTQDARSIVTAIKTCPVGKKKVAVLYSLSATAEESRWCTPVSRKLLEAHVAPFIVACSVEDMLFDITQHVLCPASRRLNEREVKELCKSLRCPDTREGRIRVLPHLQFTDPVCKMRGYFVGDVIMFDRLTHVYWRVVVS